MLTPRENQILRAIVNEYVASAQPVGSRLLWTRYGLGISPATIRTVMGALTEAGFLEQPHTSAGRVPTERAYRMFLEGAEAGSPSVGEQEKIALRMRKAGSSAEAVKNLCRQLAETSGGAGVFLSDDGPQFFGLANVFGHGELADPRVARYLAELLDQTEEWLPKLASKQGQLAIRIGPENDDFRARHISVLATKLSVDGQPAYIAVVGPTRMPYRKLTSLFEYGLKEMAARRA